MTCPAHRVGHLAVKATARTDVPEQPRPITDADARAVVTKALDDASGTTLWFADGPRIGPVEVQWQGSFGADGIHMTVWDAEEKDDAPGVDYVVTVTRLARCDTHHRHFRAADRVCDLCVLDQTENDS